MAPRPQSFARPLESGPGHVWPKYVVAGGRSLKHGKCQTAIRSDVGFGNADGHGQSVKNGAPLHTACVTSFHVAKSTLVSARTQRVSRSKFCIILLVGAGESTIRLMHLQLTYHSDPQAVAAPQQNLIFGQR